MTSNTSNVGVSAVPKSPRLIGPGVAAKKLGITTEQLNEAVKIAGLEARRHRKNRWVGRRRLFDERDIEGLEGSEALRTVLEKSRNQAAKKMEKLGAEYRGNYRLAVVDATDALARLLGVLKWPSCEIGLERRAQIGRLKADFTRLLFVMGHADATLHRVGTGVVVSFVISVGDRRYRWNLAEHHADYVRAYVEIGDDPLPAESVEPIPHKGARIADSILLVEWLIELAQGQNQTR